jgi:2-methylaconitate cis-trans-isomerase PrpF
MFRREDLPDDPKQWDPIFLQVMGSPDPNGRQLDGMGGGTSSLSKICVVGRSSRRDVDVDYTFAQIAIKEALVDYGGNCGNMAAAVGPFAVEEGIVSALQDGEAVVRIYNTNTSKVIVSRFPVAGGGLAADGNFEIDGVAGEAAPIRLEFLDPGGAKTGVLLPTRAARNDLDVPVVGRVAVSCVDAGNPCVFVAARDMGKTGVELPDELERDAAFLHRMEAIRRSASVYMGLASDPDMAGRMASIPKVAMVCAPQAAPSLSGRSLMASQVDICIRMISIGQPHRAVPITGAICLAVAVRVPGTIPYDLCGAASGPVRIGHPSGTTVVDAAVAADVTGAAMRAEYGAVYRSARRLFDGNVLYRVE